MKRVTETVWVNSKGDTLLRQIRPGEWTVIPSTVDVVRMEELIEALNDALAEAAKGQSPKGEA